MNDEIKEILEQLEWYRKIGKKDVYYPECVLPNKKAFILLDYITNLQENNDNQMKYIADLLVQITNLQQENDDLKNRLENEIADNKLRWQEYNFFKNKYIEERTKNAKAIEYMKENNFHYMNEYALERFRNDLLNILQNGSEDGE